MTSLRRPKAARLAIPTTITVFFRTVEFDVVTRDAGEPVFDFERSLHDDALRH
jgi:hypothetical protein